MNAQAMLASPRKAYLLLHAETDLDAADPGVARAALKAAECVIALSPFRSGVAEHADVVLPISPFSETAGTFINCEGRVQAFNGVAPPLGEARPAGKCCACWGRCSAWTGSRRTASRPSAWNCRRRKRSRRAVECDRHAIGAPADADVVPERVADVPMYFADPLVRRAASLQKTRNARPPAMRANAATLARLLLYSGDPAGPVGRLAAVSR
jgi:NADH-quinone oxidoreductase subunit G